MNKRRIAHMFVNVLAGVLILGLALLFFFQHRMIYYPHGYGFLLELLPPRDAEVLRYPTSCGRQAAFWVAPRSGAPLPAALWVVFNGNAALALDLLDTVQKAPDPDAGFLLVDYPGYGECQGAPTPRTILENSEKAVAALAARLKTDPDRLLARLRIFGYSLGAAAGLQFAARHGVERLVLISPFTTLTEMARRMFGWPLCYLLRHRFDNVARLAELARRSPRPGVVMIHGGADTFVPASMSRRLVATVPGWIEYHEIPGAEHNDVLDRAEPFIIPALAP